MNLTDYSLLKFDGDEAQTFLSAQLANDVRLITDSHFQYGCWCDPKGRVLSFFRLFRWQQSYYLLLPADLSEVILKRLRMFILRTKVAVTDVTDSLSLTVWSGEQIDAQLLKAGVQLPEEAGQQLQDADQITLSLPGVVPRYLRVSATAAPDSGLPVVDSSAFHLIDIASAIPHINAQNSGEYIPQMLNLDLLAAVSFNKGCYPGQEIVTRLKHRGGLKQRCYLFCATNARDIVAGMPILNAQQEKIGQVLNAQAQADGTLLLLAVIRISSATGECLLEGHAEALKRLATPYPISDE